MKKLLLTYASYGSGHKAVAMYIKDYYAKLGYEVKTIDLLSYSIPVLGTFSRVACEFLMTKLPSAWSFIYFMFDNRLTSAIYKRFSLKLFDNKKLKKEIEEFKPDLTIATHFYGSSLIAKYKKAGIIKTKLITIVTDYKAHDMWLKEVNNTDAIIVSSLDEKRKVLKYGFKSKQIYTSGIPITPKVDLDQDITKLIKEFKLKKGKKNILFFCGGGKGATNNLKYLKAILKLNLNVNVLLIAGKSKRAYKKSLNIVRKNRSLNTDVKVYGFVNNISEFYMVSDFVITKPGGAQATECLYFKKPMILIKSNGGQEIENRIFLKRKGYALSSISIYGFIKNVKTLVTNEKVLNKMERNISKINQEKSMEKLYKLSEKLLK